MIFKLLREAKLSKLDKKIKEIKKEDNVEIEIFKNIKTVDEKTSTVKLPFIHLVKTIGLSRPLLEALKLAFNLTDSTLISEDDLKIKTEKWLCSKPSDENNRRVK